MEKKLFPEMLTKKGIHKIARHKLSCMGMSVQQEKTQTQAWKGKGKGKGRTYTRPQSILKRGVMLHPSLYLAFTSEEDAVIAARQHLCLCRNEDVVLPDTEVLKMDEETFNALPGFELRFGKDYPDAFMVGFNRFDGNTLMYGRIEIGGEAVLAPQKSNE